MIDRRPDELHAALEEGRRLTFEALPELPNEPADEKTDAFLLALEQAKRSDEVYLEAIGKLDEAELDGEVGRKIERALKDRVRASLGMKPRPKREEISKAVFVLLEQ